MTSERLREITSRYARLKIAVVGDVCLDRYFEIDPARPEISIETNLPVHNVTRVRCQPGAAGTIMNNLAALGVGSIFPSAIIGQDGEGYELRRALKKLPGMALDWIVETPERATFTYSKPLLMHAGKAPEELSRLDIKNWSPTPAALQEKAAAAVRELAARVDAMILLDQVDVPETGVVTRSVLDAVRSAVSQNPALLVLADSRRGLTGYPPVCLKMNAAELGSMLGVKAAIEIEDARRQAARLAQEHGQPVFITMSERGMIGAGGGDAAHVACLPLRGEIDIVGAGDSVTANLTAALAAGATLREAMELAQLAASIVIHQLGTTGTASPAQLAELLETTRGAFSG